MAERIGIKHFFPFEVDNQLQSLKRNLLFFDRMGVLHLEDLLTLLREQQPPWIKDSLSLANEFEWLRDQNLIFEINYDKLPRPTNADMAGQFIELFSLANRVSHEASGLLSELLEFTKKANKANVSLDELPTAKLKLDKLQRAAAEFHSRAVAIPLNESPSVIATPVIETMARLPKELRSKEVDIINIVLEKIPTPASSTPWEQILDFKNDSDSRSKLIGLRQWTSAISKENLSVKEADEKLQWLLNEYTKHMEYHKMKTQIGAIKFMLISGAEIVENLARLKFGEVAKTILSTKSIRTNLMEAELSAPNRELSYLHLVNEKFGNKI